VTIVYEGPGLLLTLRGRANEGGARGETITIANPQTKKTLQGKVVAPGTVSVGPALPGRVAASTMPAQP
jgi:flagella basal body P-ring formation protein FlgA